ncbi:hypothetical protein NSK11_contig00117-0026 [Nocardia seriolae]|uniref:Uncharacterized protein n=1 Tax=Nocardia seriolae TaxID=37332 RepID=A0ABC9Z156_9NOCA|nr:hypothetical protein NS07_v2contig00111-0026 [Nocardia seriolae]GAP31534.1 hypothetical protein NSK11_contig00117-0026 [Nocardia seriolae]
MGEPGSGWVTPGCGAAWATALMPSAAVIGMAETAARNNTRWVTVCLRCFAMDEAQPFLYATTFEHHGIGDPVWQCWKIGNEKPQGRCAGRQLPVSTTWANPPYGLASVAHDALGVSATT